MVGVSPTMREVFLRIRQVAPAGTPVLFTGEPGTGKACAAAALHAISRRNTGPFVCVDCAALSERYAENELFGNDDGIKGKFGEATYGTVFLDEITALAPWIQLRLLQILQEHSFTRPGGGNSIPVDVRILAATSGNVESSVASGALRKELYYRISVFPIELPPLRNRIEDCLPLIDYFIKRYANSYCKRISRISTQAAALCTAWNWPGNVRELEHSIEHAVVVCSTSTIEASDLPLALRSTGSRAAISLSGTLKMRVRMVEIAAITEALIEVGGNLKAAAKSLGCTMRILRYKMKVLGIDGETFKQP